MNDIGLGAVGPGTFVFLRFALAALVVLGALALFGTVHFRLLRAPWFWGLCAANALAFLLQYFAQTYTTPARTALFVNTSAFCVAILERLLFGMRLGWKRWLAVALGFLGAGILIVGGDVDELFRVRLVGDVLAMLTGAIWSVYFVYNDRAVERDDPIHLTAWVFAGTAALLAAAPLLDRYLPRQGAAPASAAVGALAIVYSGLVTTALAFGLWTYGLTRIRASVSAVLLLVEILVASLVSVALGRESFGAVELVGAGLLVGAVLLVSAVAAGDHSRGPEVPEGPRLS